MQILVKLPRKIKPIALLYTYGLSPKWRKKPFVAKQIQKLAHVIFLVTVTQLLSWSPETLLVINSTFVAAMRQSPKL